MWVTLLSKSEETKLCNLKQHLDTFIVLANNVDHRQSVEMCAVSAAVVETMQRE